MNLFCFLTSGQQLLAKRDAIAKVILPGVDLGFVALVVVHQELNTGDIARLLRSGHLADKIIHPEHEVPDHDEELEQVRGVMQLVLSRVSHGLELEPGSDDL